VSSVFPLHFFTYPSLCPASKVLSFENDKEKSIFLLHFTHLSVPLQMKIAIRVCKSLEKESASINC